MYMVIIYNRNTIKEDLACSATELVFDTPLSLSGQYFSPSTDLTPTMNFVQELQHKMPKLVYTPPQHRSTDIYIPHHLKECKILFLRRDAVKHPLTPMYPGLFKVLNCTDKHITINRGNHNDTVSIDQITLASIQKADLTTPSDASTDSSEPSPDV